MGKKIEALARFVAGAQWHEVPPEVRHHAKLVVLDILGVMLAGSRRPEVRDKFHELAGEVLTGEGVVAVERAVDRFEEWPSIA